jgi:hypothetical protein
MNRFHLFKTHIYLRLLVTSLCFTMVQFTYAFSSKPTPLYQISERSNAIYLTEVVNIAYHTSLPNQYNDRAQPFTFITYKILKTLRGKPKETITLRFLGGAYADGTVMSLSSYPEFDKGDTDILFISGNSEYACPLVHCAEGRFRIINGYVFNESGQTILDIQSKKEIGYGKPQTLKQVLTHTIVHPKTGEAVELNTGGLQMPAFPIEGNVFKVDLFMRLLGDINQTLPPPKIEEVTADPYKPFFSYHLQTKQPNGFPLPPPTFPETHSDELEKWAFEINGGNPVLPQ